MIAMHDDVDEMVIIASSHSREMVKLYPCVTSITAYFLCIFT